MKRKRKRGRGGGGKEVPPEKTTPRKLMMSLESGGYSVFNLFNAALMFLLIAFISALVGGSFIPFCDPPCNIPLIFDLFFHSHLNNNKMDK